MKILLSSHFFHPSVGGLEEVSRILATEFVRASHEVQVVTQTREDDGTPFPFAVHRQPSPTTLLRLVEWCDVFFHNNISLRAAWPLLIRRRPWVVAHHTWLTRVDGRLTWRDRLKQHLLHQARNIAVSEALRARIHAPSVVIGNPYSNHLFRIVSDIPRDLDLVFLGRLVNDKGLDILFHALASLRGRGLKPSLTVIGAGPEEASLRSLSAQLGLEPQIHFVGQKTGEELVGSLNRHRILVVPSRWEEPFGLVALEGMACGCVVLAADGGGLPEAVGPAGRTFRRGDAEDAAVQLAQLLDPATDLQPFREAAPAHLARHTAEAVAARYLQMMKEAVER